MRRFRAGGPILLALAISAAAAAPATAAPEFLHGGSELMKKGFKVKNKTGTTTTLSLSGGSYKITCTTTTSEGKIKGKTEVEKTVTRFKGCNAKKGAELAECPVKSTSPEGKAEEIITKELKGKLGVVAASEATSEVGLKLEPLTGETYATIKGSVECLPKETSEVKGSLIGEVTPTKKQQLIGELMYKAKLGEQLVKKFVGESNTHELEIFGVRSPLESKDEIEYEETVEVT